MNMRMEFQICILYLRYKHIKNNLIFYKIVIHANQVSISKSKLFEILT